MLLKLKANAVNFAATIVAYICVSSPYTLM